MKGMGMGGEMGGERVSSEKLEVLKVIGEEKLVLMKGCVGGWKG